MKQIKYKLKLCWRLLWAKHFVVGTFQRDRVNGYYEFDINCNGKEANHTINYILKLGDKTEQAEQIEANEKELKRILNQQIQ